MIFDKYKNDLIINNKKDFLLFSLSFKVSQNGERKGRIYATQ